MPRSSARLAAVSLACLLLSAGLARADLISWSFSWAPGTQTLHADAPGSGTVALSSFGGTLDSHPGELVGVAAAYATYSSTAPDAAPDHFTHAPFSLTLGLTDNASHQSGSLTFTGAFDGDLSATSGAGLGVTPNGTAGGTLTLGSHLYTVSLGPYVAPPYPATSFPGVLVADVRPSNVQPAPGPSGLVLGGLALPLLGLAARRQPPPRARTGRPVA
jgi:hypothetical protein